MKKYEVSGEFLNAILGYLGTKPYVEVQELIQYLMSETQTQGAVEVEEVVDEG